MGLKIEFDYVANGSMMHANANKTPIKTLDTKACWSLLADEHVDEP